MGFPLDYSFLTSPLRKKNAQNFPNPVSYPNNSLPNSFPSIDTLLWPLILDTYDSDASIYLKLSILKEFRNCSKILIIRFCKKPISKKDIYLDLHKMILTKNLPDFFFSNLSIIMVKRFRISSHFPALGFNRCAIESELPDIGICKNFAGPSRKLARL